MEALIECEVTYKVIVDMYKRHHLDGPVAQKAKEDEEANVEPTEQNRKMLIKTHVRSKLLEGEMVWLRNCGSAGFSLSYHDKHHHVPHSTSTEYKDMFPYRRDNHNFVLTEGLQTHCYDRAIMEQMVKEYMIKARPSQSTNQTTAIGRKLRNMDQTDKLLIQKQCHCVCPDEKSGWRPGSDRRGRPVLPRHGRHLPGRVP